MKYSILQTSWIEMDIVSRVGEEFNNKL